MSAQEEEMRQNMEELQATQEESARREGELKSYLEAIDNLFAKAELDLDKSVLDINEIFTQTFGFSGEEIKGRTVENIIDEESKEMFSKDWEKSKTGKITQNHITILTKAGEKQEMLVSLSPLKDKDDNIQKVLLLAMEKK
jgi:PAS domain S-box-containing protein